jgi:hypothetical protein
MNRFIRHNKFIKGNGPQKPLSTIQRNEAEVKAFIDSIDMEKLIKDSCKILHDRIMNARLNARTQQ